MVGVIRIAGVSERENLLDQSEGGDLQFREISRQFYGDAHEYMRTFYANKDKMSDPNKVQAGMKLTIPAAEQK